MKAFAYVRPETLAEAMALQDGGTFLAGGTDLLTLMKHRIATPERLVDIKRLPELDDRIEPAAGGLRIGALATLAQLEDDPLVRGTYPALAEAAALAASPQLRNMATIGGNLLQRPRCWYYRNEHVTCWLKGGEDCPAREGENQYHALFGESPCVAVHPSDPATALHALDATIEVSGLQGNRAMPLSALYALPDDGRRTETTLGPGEVITAVRLPALPATARSAYRKAMDRKVWAFALVSVAVRLELEDGLIREPRVVLGGVAPIPWRAAAAEAVLAGAEAAPETWAKAADTALQDATPLAHNGYKVPLLRTLIRRALESAIS